MILVTIPQLSVITRSEPPIELDDEFALEVIRISSELILDYYGVDDIDESMTSGVDQRRIKRVALLVAKRGYENPTLIKSEGAVGPLGGDTFGEVQYAGFELTEAEKSELDRVTTVEPGDLQQGLFVIRTTVAHGAVVNKTIYVPDERSQADLIPFGVEGEGAL